MIFVFELYINGSIFSTMIRNTFLKNWEVNCIMFWMRVLFVHIVYLFGKRFSEKIKNHLSEILGSKKNRKLYRATINFIVFHIKKILVFILRNMNFIRLQDFKVWKTFFFIYNPNFIVTIQELSIHCDDIIDKIIYFTG